MNISCLLYVSLSEPPNQFLSVHHRLHVACFQHWQQQRSKGMNAVSCTKCHWCTTALFTHCSHSTVTNYTCLQEKRNWSEEGWGVDHISKKALFPLNSPGPGSLIKCLVFLVFWILKHCYITIVLCLRNGFLIYFWVYKSLGSTVVWCSISHCLLAFVCLFF